MLQENKAIPTHIALIADGNRRWAKAHSLPGKLGHRRGLDTLEALIKTAASRGVKFFTSFIFSTENWKRTQEEIDYLMNLLEEQIMSRKIDEYAEKGYKVRIVGDRSGLRPSIVKGIERAENLTKDNNLITVVFAINYGGRLDIVNAARNLCKKVLNGELTPNSISEKDLNESLYTVGVPDPDILIRTGGEFRVSNFLLWQFAYSELFFCDKLLPDVTESDLDEILETYSSRKRRFGR
ncbi:MAG: di-trans,poly-cis-decaprenylcistransferase [Holosporales bacterium]|jgi:undecaprenyl diphosphate synthase|nr:di-trans,poly-cis-decaprenylcistransferase [Holosporales bacterium]